MAAAPDYYAVLGVSPNADETVIRAAWKALLRKYHPDTARDLPDGAERTRAVNDAWAVLGDPNRRIAYDLQRAAPPEPESRSGWMDSPYPMPPRRSTGTTLALILAFVGLPAVAITLPGVPGQVAAMLPSEGGSAAGFARSSLNQVRRLLTPAGFGAGGTTAKPAPAAPAPATAIDPVTIRLGRVQFGRVVRRHGHGGLATYSRACAERAASLARWDSEDFCAAFDIAAGRDTGASAARYVRLGATPAAAAGRLEQIRLLVR